MSLPSEKCYWACRENVANSTGSSAMFSCVPQAGQSEVIHPLDALSLKGIQIVVCHAFWTAHETHIDWLTLALLQRSSWQ